MSDQTHEQKCWCVLSLFFATSNPKKLNWAKKMQISSATSSFDVIQALYPGQFRLKTDQVAVLIGKDVQSIRNDVSDNTFFIKSYKEGSRRFFDVRDVAVALDLAREGGSTTQPAKPKLGAPKKSQKLVDKKASEAVAAVGGVI